jgi:hypothetical protein
VCVQTVQNSVWIGLFPFQWLLLDDSSGCIWWHHPQREWSTGVAAFAAHAGAERNKSANWGHHLVGGGKVAWQSRSQHGVRSRVVTLAVCVGRMSYRHAEGRRQIRNVEKTKDVEREDLWRFVMSNDLISLSIDNRLY